MLDLIYRRFEEPYCRHLEDHVESLTLKWVLWGILKLKIKYSLKRQQICFYQSTRC